MMDAERIREAWPAVGQRGAVAAAVLILLAVILVSAPPLSISAAAVLGISAIVLSLLNPLYALGALILSVPFSSLGEVSISGFEVSSTELVTGLLVSVWLANGVRRRQMRLTLGPLAIPLMLFIALVFLSVTYSPSLPLSLKELLKWLELLVVYLFVVNNVTNPRQVRAILVVLLAAAAAEALIGYYQFFARVGPDSFRIGSFLRAYGTFGQPNPFAGYLASVAIVALSVGLLPLVRRTSTECGRGLQPARGNWGEATESHDVGATRASPLPGGHSRPFRPQARGRSTQGTQRLPVPPWLVLLGLGGFGFLSIAIFMSMSRGAWLGLAAGAAVVGAVSSRTTLIVLVVLVVVLSLVLLGGSFNVLPAQIAGRITQLAEYFRLFDASRVQAGPENWAMVERMANWQAAWGMHERYPWFGVGAGNFAVAYPDFALAQWQQPKGHAHNIYLNTLAEMGVVGLGGYLLLLAAYFLHVGRTVRRALTMANVDETSILYVGIAVGVLGTLAVISVHNLFDSLFVHGMSTHMGLLLGLATVVGRLSQQTRHVADEGSARTVVAK